MSGLTVTATIAVTTLLFRSVCPAARQEAGKFVVAYGRNLKIVAAASWLLVVALFVCAAISRPSDRVAVFCVASAFFLLALYLHLEFFHVSIRFDDLGLYTTSPWRRNRFIPWSAVSTVRFSQLAQWYVLSTSRMGRVRLHLYLSGLQSLLTELDRRGIAIPLGTRPG